MGRGKRQKKGSLFLFPLPFVPRALTFLPSPQLPYDTKRPLWKRERNFSNWLILTKKIPRKFSNGLTSAWRWDKKTSYFCILLVSPPGIILLDKQNQTWDSILTQKLKLNNYSCCQKSINDDHLGQGGWILIPNETPDKTPPGFHLKWNMFFISDQILSFLLFRLRRLVKKKGRFVLHHGFQTLTTSCFHLYFGVWNP